MAKDASKGKLWEPEVCERLDNVTKSRGMALAKRDKAKARLKEINEVLQATGRDAAKSESKRKSLKAEAWTVAKFIKDLNKYIKGTEATVFDTIQDAKQGVLFPDDPSWINFADPLPQMDS